MNLNGDILLVEDDIDDQEIMQEIFDEVFAENNYKNKLVILPDSSKVADYLRGLTEKPFMLISDINMPKLDGFALREQIFDDPNLSRMCIPYIFLTTSGDNENYIEKAYSMSIQGYFAKPGTFADYKMLAKQIVSYWKTSKTPPRELRHYS
jgi:CheY-like chemotaxis protein